MAIYTIYGDASDGSISQAASRPSGQYTSDWPSAYAGPGNSSNTTSPGLDVGSLDESSKSGWSGATYECFLKFDTSPIVDTEVVTAVALTLYTSRFSGTASSTDSLEVLLYPWTSLTTSDWRTPAQLSALTQVASVVFSSLSVTDGTANVIPENGINFRTAINKTGMTSLALATSSQVNNVNYPTNGASSYFAFYAADQTGTTQDPTLVITTTAPSAAHSSTMAMMGIG